MRVLDLIWSSGEGEYSWKQHWTGGIRRAASRNRARARLRLLGQREWHAGTIERNGPDFVHGRRTDTAQVARGSDRGVAISANVPQPTANSGAWACMKLGDAIFFAERHR